MDDLISRQAVIDALEKDKSSLDEIIKRTSSFDKQLQYFVAQHNQVECDIDTINALPSAEPQIIRCKDCKHKHIENKVWTCPFGLPGGPEFFCGYGTKMEVVENE